MTGITGKIKAIQYAREKKSFWDLPGMQLAVVEFARNVASWKR